MTLREAIINIVESKQGCKATEIAPLLAKSFPELIEELGEAINIVDDLIRHGELVEVEYILPTMDYRVKSILFPKGTKIL